MKLMSLSIVARAFIVAKLLAYDSQLTNEQLDAWWLASEYIDDYPYLLDGISNKSSAFL